MYGVWNLYGIWKTKVYVKMDIALRLRLVAEGWVQKTGIGTEQVTNLELQRREKPLLNCVIKGNVGNCQRRAPSHMFRVL